MSNQADSETTQARKRRWPMVAFFVVAVLIGVATFNYFRPAVPENTPPEITFVRFEDFPDEEWHYGVFIARNPYKKPVLIIYHVAEKQESGQWPVRSNELPDSGGGFPAMILQAHESSEIRLLIPAKSEFWRVPFWWNSGLSEFSKLKLTLDDNWQAFRNGRQLPGRKWVQYLESHPFELSPFSLAYSPVITNSIIFQPTVEMNLERRLSEVDLLRR